MIIGIEATKAFERKKTGVGWYTYYLVTELLNLKHDNINFTFYVNPWSPATGVPPVKTKFLSWPLPLFWTQARLSLEMIINRPDVLFIPAHLPPLYHPKKLVVTIHDLAFKQYPEAYSKKELSLQEWGIKRVLKNAWRIIVPSEFTKREIYAYYPWHTKNNIDIIPHGIDHHIITCKKPAVKKKKYILYIGRLEHKKNIVTLIKAFAILKRDTTLFDELVLVGSPGYGYEKIKQEIEACRYKNNIHELGWLPQNSLISYLQEADAFIFPSLYEGFGLPLLEAMACGTLVACSDIPVLREIGENIPLYFNPLDPDDIAEKITALRDDTRAAHTREQTGIKHAQSFTWQKTARKTLATLTHD